MRKSRFTEDQIVDILARARAGIAVTKLCCEHSISPTTYYHWRNKFKDKPLGGDRRSVPTAISKNGPTISSSEVHQHPPQATAEAA